MTLLHILHSNQKYKANEQYLKAVKKRNTYLKSKLYKKKITLSLLSVKHEKSRNKYDKSSSPESKQLPTKIAMTSKCVFLKNCTSSLRI